jgi:hypothetical protein
VSPPQATSVPALQYRDVEIDNEDSDDEVERGELESEEEEGEEKGEEEEEEDPFDSLTPPPTTDPFHQNCLALSPPQGTPNPALQYRDVEIDHEDSDDEVERGELESEEEEGEETREEDISESHSPTPSATDLPLETSPTRTIPKSVLDSLDGEIDSTYALRQDCATSLEDVHSSVTRFTDIVQAMKNAEVIVEEDYDRLPGLIASLYETLEIVVEMAKTEGEKWQEKKQGKQRSVDTPPARAGSSPSPSESIPPFASSSRLSNNFYPSTTSASWSSRQMISIGTQSEPLFSTPLHSYTAVRLSNSTADTQDYDERQPDSQYDHKGEDYGGGEEFAMKLDDENHGDENGFDVECSIEGTKFGGEAEECGEEDECIGGEEPVEEEIKDPAAKGASKRKQDEQQDNLDE